jgi:hypothetical protein
VLHLCVPKKKATKKQQKLTKSHQNVHLPILLLLYMSKFSFFRNFQLWPFPFLFFSFNRPPQWLQKKRRYGKDGLLVLDEAPKLPHDLSSADVVSSFVTVPSSRNLFGRSNIAIFSAQVSMFLCMYVSLFFFFFFFGGFFLINFFFVCS